MEAALSFGVPEDPTLPSHLWGRILLWACDSPPGSLLRCSAPAARRCAEQRQEVQHRQNPPAVPRRHLPRDPEPEKPERVGRQERKGRASLSFQQGAEDPAGHPQHQHVPAGGGSRHPARPRGAGRVEGGQDHRLRAQGELQENQQEPPAQPGTAPARGTRPQEEEAAGDREEGGEAGDLLGEALRPARTPRHPTGLVGTPSPRAGGMRGSGTVAAGVFFGNLGQIQP